MLNGKIKKVITIALASMSIIGNAYTPVQAKTLNNAPVAKVIDCDDLTENMLIHRSNKNGKVLNPPKNGGYYISYASVKGARKGDLIITYCVYNPYSNWDDDVIERWDFIQ